MKADLILVSHNSKSDLEKFLPSIKENTDDYNLVIIENGGNDETLKFLSDYGVRFILTDNKGYGAACNNGAKNTSSEFVVFLNCDLLASKNWLKELLKPFKDKEVAVTGARLFSGDGVEYPTPKNDMAIGCCFAVRRKVFDKLGGFDENFFLFFEETDFCRRVTNAGYKVVRSEACLTHFHPHFPPFSAELQKYWDESKAYFESKHKVLIKKPSLSLVMIVKNEEKGLERAILSCRDFVTDIIIAVDNSSTDKTEEIAKKYATTLKHFDWHDDFSKARNFAHEGVKTDWILFLDGHEYVVKHDNLKNYLTSKADGLMCSIEMETGMVFGNPRIYRNGVQFEGQTHEKQLCRSTEVYPDFLIKHDRVSGQSLAASLERAKQRDEQIPRVMGERFKKNKKDIRASFHLALFTQSRGDIRAAIYWWKQFLKYAKDRGERWYAYFNLSLLNLSLGRLFRAFWYASYADYETKGRWEIAKLKGIICFEKKKFSEAASYFVDSLGENSCIVSYRPWPQNNSDVFNRLGECLYNLGIFDKASYSFNRAAELCNDEKFKTLFKDRAKLMTDIFIANNIPKK